MGIIDGKCDCIRNLSVSRLGLVDVPSGFSSTPSLLLFFLFNIFLSIYIDLVKFCLVLKSFQSCFSAFRQSLF